MAKQQKTFKQLMRVASRIPVGKNIRRHEEVLLEALNVARGDAEKYKVLLALAEFLKPVRPRDSANYFTDAEECKPPDEVRTRDGFKKFSIYSGSIVYSGDLDPLDDKRPSFLREGEDRLVKSKMFSGSVVFNDYDPKATSIPFTFGIVTGNDRLCGFCLHDTVANGLWRRSLFCSAACESRNGSLAEKEQQLAPLVRLAADSSGLEARLIQLAVRILVKAADPEDFMLKQIPANTAVSSAESLAAAILAPAWNREIKESIIAKILAGLKSIGLDVPIYTGGRVFGFIQNLKDFVTHSCEPNSEMYLGEDGNLWCWQRETLPEHTSPTADLTFDPLIIALPRQFRWRRLLAVKGWDGCPCERCVDEGADDVIQSVICHVCKGLTYFSQVDDWECAHCGVISVRPTRLTNEVVATYEDIKGELKPISQRARLEKLLEQLNEFFPPTHWLRLRVLLDLVKVLSQEPCPDPAKAELHARDAMVIIACGIPFYYSRPMQMELTVKLVAPIAMEKSLLMPPESIVLTRAIEDAILPLLVFTEPDLTSAPWSETIYGLIHKHTELLFPIATEIWSRDPLAFHPSLTKEIVVSVLAEKAKNGDIEGFKKCYDENIKLLHDNVDWLVMSTQRSLLCAAVEARQAEMVRELLTTFNSKVALRNHFGWTSLFSAAATFPVDEGSIEAQVSQGIILKLLMNIIGKDRVPYQQLRAVGGADTLLHVVSKPRIAKLLIDAGADPLAKNCHGQTAVDTAVINDRIELVEYYASRGLIRKV